MCLAVVKVSMSGTIVFEKSSMSFSVVPSLLYSIIDGGFQRFTDRSATDLVIDGSPSFDPDFPHASDMR